MSRVSIASASTYQPASIQAAVEQSLAKLSGWERTLGPGRVVLLKPNLLSPTHPDYGVTTHPAVVEAVGRLVRDTGAEVLIGDSAGGVANASRTAKALQVCGMIEVAQRIGARIVNLDQEGEVKRPNPRGGDAKPLLLTALLDRVDYLISMPKLKTHTFTRFTGSVKNMYGCIPGTRKAWYHMVAPRPELFSEYVVDVFAATQPQLTIMDAVVGMEGNGPSAGRLRPIGAVLAGMDAAAVDAVSCRLVGIEPASVPTLAAVERRELGTIDAAQIDIEGPFASLAVRDFRPPRAGLPIPSVFRRLGLDTIGGYPHIDRQACTLCGLCIDSCPVNAMAIERERVAVRRRACIRCYCCHELCPASAVSIGGGPSLRAFRQWLGRRHS